MWSVRPNTEVWLVRTHFYLNDVNGSNLVNDHLLHLKKRRTKRQ